MQMRTYPGVGDKTAHDHLLDPGEGDRGRIGVLEAIHLSQLLVVDLEEPDNP